MKNCLGSVGVATLALVLGTGCTGYVQGAGGSSAGASNTNLSPGSGGGTVAAGGPGVTPLSCAQALTAPLPTRVRRLTPDEYTNSVRALVGDQVRLPALEFPPDTALGAFHDAADLLRVTGLLADGLSDFAEKLAANATERLPDLMGCDATTGDEQACVRGFFASFGAKAYRRSLSADELQRLLDLYAQGRTTADVRTGVALGLQVVFQSPNLLYRTELGEKDATSDEVAVTADELASELSYLVTLGPPDAELTRAAAAGELSQADAREAQARRLLTTPNARGATSAFANDWLDIAKLPTLAKDPALFPDFSADSARKMQQDTQTLFNQVVLDGDGKLRSLLLGGLLTQPSVLASHAGVQLSSPTHRGKLIRNQFLCQQVPPPPPGLIVTVPQATPGVTTRQRMLTHASDPGCAACHQKMDPLGFAFEHYDAVGAFRADEGGLTIDATGEINGGTDADGAFDGAAALSQRLADSADVRACFAEQWTTFAVGGEVDDAMRCALAPLFAAFRKEQLTLPQLLLGVVRSDAFVKRHVSRP